MTVSKSNLSIPSSVLDQSRKLPPLRVVHEDRDAGRALRLRRSLVVLPALNEKEVTGVHRPELGEVDDRVTIGVTATEIQCPHFLAAKMD